MKETLALVAALFCSVSASAVTIDTIAVGDAGNAADFSHYTLPGHVEVAYE